MVIHKNCYGTILLVWLICMPLAYLILRFIPWTFLSYLLAAIPMFFMGFVLFFFRVPQRERVGEDNVATSVADGKVVVIEKVYEPEYIKGEKDWIYGVKYNGKELTFGEKVPHEAVLTLCVGDDKLENDSIQTDSLRINTDKPIIDESWF